VIGNWLLQLGRGRFVRIDVEKSAYHHLSQSATFRPAFSFGLSAINLESAGWQMSIEKWLAGKCALNRLKKNCFWAG